MKRTLWDRLMTAVKAQDAEAVKAEMLTIDAESNHTNDADKLAKLQATVDAQAKSIDALVKSVALVLAAKKTKDADEDKDETKDDDGDDEDKTKSEDGEDDDEEGDTGGEMTGDDVLEAETAQSNAQALGKVLSGDSLKQLVARAEIIAPGATFKTADAKKAERAEAVAFMRATLEKAYATADGRKAIDPFLAGREIKKLTGDSLTAAFVGAAELMRIQNNARASLSSGKTKDFGRAASVDEINARNREFWANR